MGGARVVGYCPMGCGETLFLGAGGHITCSFLECPNPSAVDEILGDGESEHIVVLGATDFSAQHPLRERIDGDLFSCELGEYLSALDGPPRKPGRYRVTPRFGIGGRWTWQEVSS